jgi:hypothetical protein
LTRFHVVRPRVNDFAATAKQLVGAAGHVRARSRLSTETPQPYLAKLMNLRGAFSVTPSWSIAESLSVPSTLPL